MTEQAVRVLSCPKFDGGVLWRCSTTRHIHPIKFYIKEGGLYLHKSKKIYNLVARLTHHINTMSVEEYKDLLEDELPDRDYILTFGNSSTVVTKEDYIKHQLSLYEVLTNNTIFNN